MKAPLSTIPLMATLVFGLAGPSSGQDPAPPPVAPTAIPRANQPAPTVPTTRPGAAVQGQSGNRYSTALGKTLISSSRDSVSPVVISFATTNDSTIEAAEADLAVMTRLIEKALDGELGEEQAPEAMGIPLVVTRGGRSVRALQLEGWGALFMIKVNFPLLPPPKAPEKKAESPTSSEWESARREVEESEGETEVRWEVKRVGGVEYDEKQVEALKKTLLFALKHATNIRHLNPEDHVAVSVFGSPNGGGGAGATTSVRKNASKNVTLSTGVAVPPPVLRDSSGAPDEDTPPGAGKARISGAGAGVGGQGGGIAIEHREINLARKQLDQAQQELANVEVMVESLGRGPIKISSVSRSGSGQGTVVTLRVKKADVDAFAKGALTFDAFQKKATINAYNGSGHGIASVSSWVEKRR